MDGGNQNPTSAAKPSEIVAERVRQPDVGPFAAPEADPATNGGEQPGDDKQRLEKYGASPGIGDDQPGPVSHKPDASQRDSVLDSLQLQLERQEQWSGPLPPPATLYQYELVQPGLADRIVTMAETVTTGEIKIREKIATAEIESARIGQSLAFLLTIVALGAAIYFFAVGNATAGGLLLSFPVIMLIRSFLTGLHSGESPKPDDKGPDGKETQRHS